MSQILVRNIWKIFGPQAAQIRATIRPDESIADIRTRTEHTIAVRDVSFEVNSGTTFVVMGLSGSGKSTLLRCIARLIEPTAGEVLIDGQAIHTMTESELRELRRQRMSMVFQSFGLLPHRRVIDNVAFGLEVQGVNRTARHAKALEMIEMVGLSGWEYHFPRQLSGGMQQRVGLARALAVNPEILLFDEPFSALDPLIRREMQDELLRLQRTLRKTSIFITHDFHEALRLGDQIAIMRAGEFVQVGPPETVVLHPRNEYVNAFVRDAPRAKVITAAAIMRPCPADYAFGNRPMIRIDAHLEEIIPLVAAYEQPLPVIHEDRTPLGLIDRVAVLKALSTNG
jgi:glycine betaine/proline transport system ATP-binding protein